MSDGYLESLPKGWMLFCSGCNKYLRQSDPQSSSLGKTIVMDTEPCEECKQREVDVREAQAICGRLGIKGDSE